MGLPESLSPQYPDGTPNYGVLLFFASFIIILNWTLLQVEIRQAQFYRDERQLVQMLV